VDHGLCPELIWYSSLYYVKRPFSSTCWFREDPYRRRLLQATYLATSGWASSFSRVL
jgi:hypothetical protein